MALPEPEPGLVFRYDFLWSREAKLGKATSKERPACVAFSSDTEMLRRHVVILPISHGRPSGDTSGIEIPAAVRQILGLDDERCWVIVTEYNVDNWPNAGIARLPGPKPVYAYGHLPPNFFERVRKAFLRHYDPRRAIRR